MVVSTVASVSLVTGGRLAGAGPRAPRARPVGGPLVQGRQGSRAWGGRVGRAGRLEVRCRTAFEKRIEAKNNTSSEPGNAKKKDARGAKSRRDGRRTKREEVRGSRKAPADSKTKSDQRNAKDTKGEKKAPESTQQATAKPQQGSAAPASSPAPAAAGGAANRQKQQAKARSNLRFDRDFGFGEQGAHVEKLQRILLAENYLASSDKITGYFGRETKEALTMWQKANRVMPSGYFGPVSRALVNKQGALTRAKQQVAVQVRVHPAGTAAVSLGLVGAVSFAAVYVTKQTLRTGVAVPAGLTSAVRGLAASCKAFVVSKVKVGGPVALALASFEEEARPAETPRRNYFGAGGPRVVKEEEPASGSGGREEYSRRVELRRNIASLQNSLGKVEDQLNSAKRELKREKERADRAETMYLEQKSDIQLLEIENQKLRKELQVAQRAAKRP
mmetsp:Transcript_40936/g.87065  ORF Transcript_40936/g.87065 Transcript_40936/m.87065 type:complete len:446 (+) Transcript_40936:78-1415(+)